LNHIFKFLTLLFFSYNFRSSGYDRDRSTTDIKKRLDDYPKRDDGYSSKSRDDYKRDSYKSSGSSRDDYKRDADISSRSYNSSSSRIDTSLNSSKDRYSDRTSSDYRSGGSRVDDTRNDSSKSRYYDSQSDTRYNRPPVVPSTTTWSGNASHQSQFGSMGTSDLWNAAKAQQQTTDNGASWSRSNMDDNRDYRFPNSDRKTSQHYPIDQTMRTTQYVSNGTSNIIPTTSTRFAGNPRW